MKTCHYCGREIEEEGRAACPGCGTELRLSTRDAQFDGVLDPITPCRRCHCGGVMRYYTPAPDRGTFLRPYDYRYRCDRCRADAMVPPWNKRGKLVFAAVAGFGAVLWLCLSKTAAEFDRSWWNTRWVVIAIAVSVVGLAAGHLALLGAWNRWRHPIVDDPNDHDDPPETNAARVGEKK